MVYVMRDYSKKGVFKIGCTTSEKHRYNAKRSRDQIILRIRATNHLRTLEEDIHKLFSHKRNAPPNAETFVLSDEDIALLRTIAKTAKPEELVNTLLGKR